MSARKMIQTSAVIGGLFGGVLGAIYVLFLPALVILIGWASGDPQQDWLNFKYAPYSIIVCALIGVAAGAVVQRHAFEGRSARIGLVLVFAMAGAGCGTGLVVAVISPIIILAGFIGASVGLTLGAIFGSLLAAIDRFSGRSWDDQLRHCVRLRLLASAVPAIGLVALYVSIHIHQGMAPALSVAEDYVIVPLVIAALAMFPVLLFGPATRRFYSTPQVTNAN